MGLRMQRSEHQKLDLSPVTERATRCSLEIQASGPLKLPEPVRSPAIAPILGSLGASSEAALLPRTFPKSWTMLSCCRGPRCSADPSDSPAREHTVSQHSTLLPSEEGRAASRRPRLWELLSVLGSQRQGRATNLSGQWGPRYALASSAHGAGGQNSTAGLRIDWFSFPVCLASDRTSYVPGAGSTAHRHLWGPGHIPCCCLSFHSLIVGNGCRES